MDGAQRRAEFQEYAQRSGVGQIMEALMTNIITEQPEDPIDYMSSFLDAAAGRAPTHSGTRSRSFRNSRGSMSPVPRFSGTPGRRLNVDVTTGEWGVGAGARPGPGLQGPPGIDDSRRSSDAGMMAAEVAKAASMKYFEKCIRTCVKIFATHVAPNYAMPWQRGEESRSTGSGFAVTLPSDGSRRILTNAHCVEHASLVQVRRAGHAQKYVAKIISIGFDLDVAILDVQDPEFWEGLELTAIGAGLPRLTSDVIAVGFPIGGEDVSTTRGVVSRILVGGLTDNLCVQVDSAINPGNSGGPVFDAQGNLAGIAYSGITGANGIGYIIPLPVIHTFLANFERNGKYVGRCTDAFEIQPMESPMLRKKFAMGVKETGVLVTKIPAESPSKGALKEHDILLEIDGVPVANDGTVKLPDCEDTVRVTFSYLVYRTTQDQDIRYSLLREGERMEVTVKAQPQLPLVLPPRQPIQKPSYVLVGGLVFVPLIHAYEGLIPREKIDLALRPPEFPGQQIVILLMVLQSEVNIGYEDVSGVLETCNGEKVKNLKHLNELVQRTEEAELNFRFTSGDLIVLDSKLCAESEQEICDMHRIPHRCSPNL